MERHFRISVPPRPFPSEEYLRLRDSGEWPREGLFPDPSFPFALLDSPSHPEVPIHGHEGFAELVLVYGGRIVHFTPESEHEVTEGDVFVLTGDMRHGYREPDDAHVLNIVFDPRRLLSNVQDVNKLPGYHALFHLEPRFRGKHDFSSRLHLAPSDLAHALTLCEELARRTTARPPGYEFISRALFMELVWFLCQCYVNRQTGTGRSLTRMGEVISHLERNYTEDLDLDTLAEVAGMSTRNLLLLFKEATGHPPIDYLIRLRVARACELLCTTGMRVTDIAAHVGFEDSNYFARQFRRVTGATPTAYRRRHGFHDSARFG